MKIVLASSFVPFVDGGGRFIVEWLERKLLEHGHEVERIYLPFVDYPHNMFAQMAAYRLIDLTEACDRLIAFRPPAYMLRHPCKILWFIHHIRTYYDLWNTEYRPVPDSVSGRAIRDTVFAADNATLGEARHIFTNSRTVSDRLRQFNGIESEVLYPPLRDPERFRSDGYGDEIVCVSRVEHHKRQHLLIEALRHTQTPVKLRLCGMSCSPPTYSEELKALASRLGLDGRVVFEQRWISEEEKIERLAPALAAAYIPFDEDSYGYPSLEASHARKAILTTTDSGGVTELVIDSLNGYVCAPHPQALGAAMDRLFLDRSRALTMGQAGYQRVLDLGITWDKVVQKLLA
jgi:glycosyltransferase involved in cell wall biosynthesis